LSGTGGRTGGIRLPEALGDYAVVYFGNDWFAENRTSSHHIARRLGQRMPLLYVDSPGLRAPAASARDLGRLVRKLREAVRGPRRLGEQMWHCTVPQLPLGRWSWAGSVGRRLSRGAVRRAVRRLGFQRLLSWFVVPHPGYLAGRLGEEYVVYYCIDDYAGLPGVDAAAVARMDEELSRRADVVFAASPRLLEAKRRLNPAVVFSPHGVDVELFARALDPALPPAPATADLAHPVIGLVGVLDERFDLELLAYLGRARPEWTFLIVGRVAAEVSELRRLGNFFFAGPQPYESLPGWMKAFDVGIMPYRRGRQGLSANPLKMREYLAAGKPVVAAAIPEAERFQAVVRIAREPGEFLEQIEAALREDCEAERAARLASVAGMSWEARVGEILEEVGRRLERKRAAADQGRA